MKKYLFGLGAMLVGAGLMFVLMHGEVRADSRPEPFVCSKLGTATYPDGKEDIYDILHCRVGKLDCGVAARGTSDTISCVQTGGLFR